MLSKLMFNISVKNLYVLNNLNIEYYTYKSLAQSNQKMKLSSSQKCIRRTSRKIASSNDSVLYLVKHSFINAKYAKNADDT